MSEPTSPSHQDEVLALKARIAQLELELKAKPVRKAVEKMEEIVVDSNPYSYVFSLKSILKVYYRVLKI